MDPSQDLRGVRDVAIADGRILANNTDEGPKPHARGQSLGWTVGPSTQQPPTALVAFD